MEKSDFLQDALNYANVKKLPKEVEGAYEGMAIILMTKVNNKQVYGIGKWDTKLKRSSVAKDFTMIRTLSVDSAYPLAANKGKEDLISDAEKKAKLVGLGYRSALIKKWSAEMVDKELEQIEAAVKELNLLGVKVETGMLDDLLKQIEIAKGN
jgi:hypothetical protein